MRRRHHSAELTLLKAVVAASPQAAQQHPAPAIDPAAHATRHFRPRAGSQAQTAACRVRATGSACASSTLTPAQRRRLLACRRVRARHAHQNWQGHGGEGLADRRGHAALRVRAWRYTALAHVGRRADEDEQVQWIYDLHARVDGSSVPITVACVTDRSGAARSCLYSAVPALDRLDHKTSLVLDALTGLFGVAIAVVGSVAHLRP